MDSQQIKREYEKNIRKLGTEMTELKNMVDKLKIKFTDWTSFSDWAVPTTGQWLCKI